MDGYGVSGKRSLYDDNGGERNNNRLKRRSGSASDGPLQAEETEYRILCPVSKIGSLIGKGGSIIKNLRTECKCKIKVEDPLSGSDERVVLIISSADQSREQGFYVCAAQEALFKVHARIAEADEEDDEDEPPQPVCARLLVPKNHIGCLLGKGGKIIEQMRKEIGAQIRILPKEVHPLCAGSTDELVQVTGDASLVKKALFEISSRLHEDMTGERSKKNSYTSQGSGKMTASMFAGSGGMYPSMRYVHAGSLLGPGSVGDPMYGLGYSYGGMYGDMSMGNSWGSSMPSTVAGTFAHSDGATEEEFTVRVLCPNTRIGSIIGKGGSIIKKMRDDTGANIKVEEQIVDCDERVVLISALEFVDAYPSPVIQATMQVFRRLVEMQMEKDIDMKSFFVRLLVPSTQIGCLLGKGGSIVSEMRKNTKATIRISPKDEPSRCAKENDELVQVMGDQNVVQDALFQILSRLRGNVFKGQEGTDRASGFGSSMLPTTGTMYTENNMMNGYRRGLDSGAAGIMYPFTNLGYHGMDYGYGGVGAQASFGREQESKDSRRRPR